MGAYKRRSREVALGRQGGGGPVVPLAARRTTQPWAREGALLHPCLTTTEGPAHAPRGDDTAKQDKVRELQVKLYLAAKRSPIVASTRSGIASIAGMCWSGRGKRCARTAALPALTASRSPRSKRTGSRRSLTSSKRSFASSAIAPAGAAGAYPKARALRARPLGIPSVKDRVCQTAAKLVLEPIFEADFRDCSFGFRPKRSAHDALDRSARGDAGPALGDRRRHPRLLRRARSGDPRALVCERISDRRVLKLLRSWLRAGVLEGETLMRPEAGSPQGSPISPLLANVYLNALDRAWEDRLAGWACWSATPTTVCRER